MENKNNLKAPHIVIVPSPGMGHQIPLAELAKLLHSTYNFSITLLLPTSTPPTATQTAYFSSFPAGVSYTFLPPVDPAFLPSGAKHETTISYVNLHSAPLVRESLVALTRDTRVVGLVTDLFGTDFFDVAKEHGVPSYLYFTSTAMCLSLLLHMPRLAETVSCEYRDMVEPVVLPGCVPLHGKEFLDTVQNRKDEAHDVLLNHIRKYSSAEGIFVNSFIDLEPGALRALQKDYPGLPPVYPVGPMIQSGSNATKDESGCLAWLDQQPPSSVLFVAFGSGGTLSLEQVHELALGLEKSGQRFIWVVRSPDKSSAGSFFTQNSDDPLRFLPMGFVGRIKDRGLLVPHWAPQIQILAHESTGGFLTHCGWNSTLESITNGVPLIAWPLYAEQKMNAVMLKEEAKVVLRPNKNENGVIEENEIANIVKELMEGEEGKRVRKRMKELSDSATKTRAKHGDSTKSFDLIAQKLVSN